MPLIRLHIHPNSIEQPAGGLQLATLIIVAIAIVAVVSYSLAWVGMMLETTVAIVPPSTVVAATLNDTTSTMYVGSFGAVYPTTLSGNLDDVLLTFAW